MSTDVFSPEQRSAVMRRVKGRDTSPELAVRRILRAAGIGYRLGGQGCFWHGHDCARGARKPKANAEYWSAKIDRNRARDARVTAQLRDDGWRVLTVWECDLRTPGFAERLVADVRDQAAAISAA
jgi:DNA mismatch endonuclease (patch repair protein)